jgi:hypothetical protein
MHAASRQAHSHTYTHRHTNTHTETHAHRNTHATFIATACLKQQMVIHPLPFLSPPPAYHCILCNQERRQKPKGPCAAGGVWNEERARAFPFCNQLVNIYLLPVQTSKQLLVNHCPSHVPPIQEIGPPWPVVVDGHGSFETHTHKHVRSCKHTSTHLHTLAHLQVRTMHALDHKNILRFFAW